jgi:hypothetical protein
VAAVRYGGAGVRAGGAGVSDPEVFRVYAVKYAEKDGRRSEHFLGGDPHDGPMPMDYFMWLAKGEAAALLSIPGSTPK